MAERAMLAAAAALAGGTERCATDGMQVQRIGGGFNNAVFRVEGAGQTVACKVFAADECRRAAREYGALRLLERAGCDVAPRPLWLEERYAALPYPAVCYAWVAGRPLAPPLSQRQLSALLSALQQLHSLRAEEWSEAGLPDAWFHWFDIHPYVEELGQFAERYGPWLAGAAPDGPQLRRRLEAVVRRSSQEMLRSTAVIGREAVPRCLVRVDQNLANALWCQDGRLRWVDWEYSGWGDPALDLAELRWRVVLADVDGEQHAWLRAHYRRPAGDVAFDDRLDLWDGLVSARWPFLPLRWLWSQECGPDRERLGQGEVDAAEMWTRFHSYLERAEQVGR